MTQKEVQLFIENYQEKAIGTRHRLARRLLDVAHSDPMQGELIYSRLKEIDKIEAIIYDYSIFTDKEVVILSHRALGKTLEEIGQSFGLGKERIRQILSGCYRKLAKEYNKPSQDW